MSPLKHSSHARESATAGAARNWLRGANQLGTEAALAGKPYIHNEGRLLIGNEFRLSSHPVQSHFVVYSGAEMVIGDRVTFSYGAAIAVLQRVTIGDDTRIGPFAVIMDGDFHSVGDRNAQGATEPIYIGRAVEVGARVTILRGSMIGDGARLESGCVVSGRVPAGATVAGAPARPVTVDQRGGPPELRELVARTLGLSSTPSLDDGPAQIPQWDSLGSLRLLLAVEEEFSIALNEDAISSARSIRQLAEVIAEAVEKPHAT